MGLKQDTKLQSKCAVTSLGQYFYLKINNAKMVHNKIVTIPTSILKYEKSNFYFKMLFHCHEVDNLKI